MAYASKSKHRPTSRRQATYSANLHTKKARLFPSHPRTFAQKLILVTIIMTIILVILAIVSSFLLQPERLVKSRLSAIASDYYENHLYANFENSPQRADITDLDEFMQKYATHGFARVSLRQLLLYDNEKYTSDADYLLTYCDANTTYVKFYPDPPYDRTSYHFEFTYSCAF